MPIPTGVAWEAGLSLEALLSLWGGGGCGGGGGVKDQVPPRLIARIVRAVGRMLEEGTGGVVSVVVMVAAVMVAEGTASDRKDYHQGSACRRDTTHM